jgi:hypothetical protein
MIRLGERVLAKASASTRDGATPSTAPRVGALPAGPLGNIPLHAPGDAHEREAERISQRIAQGLPAGPITPVAAPTPQAMGDEGSGAADSVPADAAADLRTLDGGGTPLTGAQRDYYEPRLGRDLGGARLHGDAAAADLAERLDARALAYGPHIVMGRGAAGPAATPGDLVMTHELVHHAQQQDAAGRSVQRVVWVEGSPINKNRNVYKALAADKKFRDLFRDLVMSEAFTVSYDDYGTFDSEVRADMHTINSKFNNLEEAMANWASFDPLKDWKGQAQWSFTGIFGQLPQATLTASQPKKKAKTGKKGKPPPEPELAFSETGASEYMSHTVPHAGNALLYLIMHKELALKNLADNKTISKKDRQKAEETIEDTFQETIAAALRLDAPGVPDFVTESKDIAELFPLMQGAQTSSLGGEHIVAPVQKPAATTKKVTTIAEPVILEEAVNKMRQQSGWSGAQLIERHAVPLVPRYGSLYQGMGQWAYFQATPESSFPQGSSAAGTMTNLPWDGNVLKKRRVGEPGNDENYYIRGHLLNDHLGGVARHVNLVPLSGTGSASSGNANKAHEAAIESEVKNIFQHMKTQYERSKNKGPFTPSSKDDIKRMAYMMKVNTWGQKRQVTKKIQDAPGILDDAVKDVEKKKKNPTVNDIYRYFANKTKNPKHKDDDAWKDDVLVAIWEVADVKPDDIETLKAKELIEPMRDNAKVWKFEDDFMPVELEAIIVVETGRDQTSTMKKKPLRNELPTDPWDIHYKEDVS